MTHLLQPVRLRTIYGLCAVSHSGKDAVLAAAQAIAGVRLGHFIRYTTRPLRDGDVYVSVTPGQREDWLVSGRIVDEICMYGGVYYFQLREERDRILSARPVASHFTVDVARRYRAQGIGVSFSRLVTPGRERADLSERVQVRSAEDAERQREIDASDAFNGPEIANRFDLDEPTRIRDRSGAPIPRGAVLAAVEWLRYIAACEGWDPSFIGEGLAVAVG